jgi:hypothetical protein
MTYLHNSFTKDFWNLNVDRVMSRTRIAAIWSPADQSVTDNRNLVLCGVSRA